MRYWNRIPKDNPYTVKESIIANENRAKIHNEIVESVEMIREETRLLQIQLLHRLFEELIKNPEKLDKDSRKLVERIISARKEDERKGLANRFYKKMIKRWRKQLKKNGYVFIEDTWDKLRALS